MLIGIDGTNSEKWLPELGYSHVDHMVKNYQGESTYFHGPGTSGNGLERAVNDAVSWILARLRTAYRVEHWTGKKREVISEGVEDSYFRAVFKASSMRTQCIINRNSNGVGPMRASFSFPEKTSVNLIGHSRGGLAVIEVARRLRDFNPSIAVNFLGLFDAVDRYLYFDGDSIPANVKYAYHAIRDPKVGSRSSFGNTGTSVENHGATLYVPKIFKATHGALGGDPVGGDRVYISSRTTTIFSDTSDCKAVYGVFVRTCLFEKERISLKENSESAKQAGVWMMSNAKRHGVNINIPYDA